MSTGPGKINLKNIFSANLKYREVVKNRFCVKIHTSEIKVYYSILGLSVVFMLIQTEAIAAILILSLIFDYWHNELKAVVSDLWILRVTASAEGCLSTCPVFFLLIGSQEFVFKIQSRRLGKK